MSQSQLTLMLQRASAGTLCDLTLLACDSETLSASTTLTLPGTAEDSRDLRWLVEHSRLVEGSASAGVRTRVARRMRWLGQEMTRQVFGRSIDAQRIAEALVARGGGDLTVAIDAPPGHLPWELVCVPGLDRPLSVSAASFVHRSADVSRPVRRRRRGQTRILLVVARPRGVDDVPFRSVAARMLQATAGPSRSPIRVDVLRPPTFRALRTRLAEANDAGDPYDIVHFDGHGVLREPAFGGEGKRGFVCFEDEDGKQAFVSGANLREALAGNHTGLLFLNACRSAYAEPVETRTQARRVPFESLASEVAHGSGVTVIAMAFDVYVATAARFVEATYTAIAAGAPAEQAATEARRQLYDAAAWSGPGGCDWLVPVVFAAGHIPPKPASAKAAPVRVSSGTPANPLVTDPQAGGGPRSPQRPFFGFDEVILDLERGFRSAAVIELVGLAGCGKSALAAEFARWTVATSAGRRATVIEMGRCDSFAAFEQAVAQDTGPATGSDAPPALWVLEDPGPRLDGGAKQWPKPDRRALSRAIAEHGERGGQVLLTGRAPCGIANASTIAVPGLSFEARAELATTLGWRASEVPAGAMLLDWTAGLPVLVRELPRLTQALGGGGVTDAQDLLSQLRSGGGDRQALAAHLIERCGLRRPDRWSTTAWLPLHLFLFQGYVDVERSGLLEAMLTGGAGGDEDAAEPHIDLHATMVGAVRRGLARRCGETGYVLHPLASAWADREVAWVLAASANGDLERSDRLCERFLWAYCAAERSSQAFDPYRRATMPRESMVPQNVWSAFELAAGGPWWDLALPLGQRLRDELVAAGRVEEWQQALARLASTFVLVTRAPGSDRALQQLVGLLAAEVDRLNDRAAATKLSDLALVLARAMADEVVTLEDGSMERIPTGRNALFTQLIRRGDLERSADDPSCLSYYNEAREIADDDIRRGTAELALARSYNTVSSIADSRLYEAHSREAVALSENIDRAFHLEAMVSVAIAIVVQIQEGREPDERSIAEARHALALGRNSGPGYLRAASRNTFGILAGLQGDWRAAAEAYLQAADEFEAIGELAEVVSTTVNATRALLYDGRVDDARIVANRSAEALSELKGAPAALSAQVKANASLIKKSEQPQN